MKWAFAVCSEFHTCGSNQLKLRFLLGNDSEETITAGDTNSCTIWTYSPLQSWEFCHLVFLPRRKWGLLTFRQKEFRTSLGAWEPKNWQRNIFHVFLLYPHYYNLLFFFSVFSLIVPYPNCLIPYLLPFLPSHCSVSGSMGDILGWFHFSLSALFLDTFNQYIAARMQETAYKGRNTIIKYC